MWMGWFGDVVDWFFNLKCLIVLGIFVDINFVMIFLIYIGVKI